VAERVGFEPPLSVERRNLLVRVTIRPHQIGHYQSVAHFFGPPQGHRRASSKGEGAPLPALLRFAATDNRDEGGWRNTGATESLGSTGDFGDLARLG
jgi:hypothetical protein